MTRKLLVLLASFLGFGLQQFADAADGYEGGRPAFRHVLLISVDGLHALDLTNYVRQPPGLDAGRV